MNKNEIKDQVRHFYDQVGWIKDDNQNYQNAQYEDLRPISREYIHRCHLRVNRYLQPDGKYFLDAGSGPVQYVEYLTYSQGYQYRVCLDISFTALIEARRQIKDHGFYVLADVSKLPFRKDVFSGEVSLHTLHHLEIEAQNLAYRELHRCLKAGCTAVIVNGWKHSWLMEKLNPLIVLMEKLQQKNKRNHRKITEELPSKIETDSNRQQPKRTFVQEINAELLKNTFQGEFPLEIFVWRSVSVRFLRAMIQPWNAGKIWLKLIYWLEEHFPIFMGENGSYPLIVVEKVEI